MDSLRGAARPKPTKVGRRDSLADRLQLRLFAVHFRVITSDSWRFVHLSNSYWRMYVNEEDGAMLQVYDAKRRTYPFPLSAGQLYFIPAGVAFDTLCRAPMVGHLYAHFDLIGLPGLLLRKLFDRPLVVDTSADMRDRATVITEELRSKKEDARESLAIFCRTKALLYDAIAVALEGLTAADQEQHYARAALLEPVLPALEIIEKQMSESLTNDILATACSLSEDYFIRRFKECVGEPPGTFLIRRRIETAAQRLSFTTDTIERIATECGFGNRFYFTRVFTQHTGSAPGAYRRAARA